MDNVFEVVRQEVPDDFKLIMLDAVTRHQLLKSAHLADYFLASGRLRIDREIIDAAINLKMIQRTGVGTDTLDTGYLAKKQIPLQVNHGVNSNSVAEHTLLLILSVLRQIPAVDASVRQGVWQKNDIGIQTRELHRKTVGLLGLGSIGRKVARMLQPFSTRICYYDISRLPEAEEKDLKLSYLPFPELLETVDILSLHCPLNSETRGLIGTTEMAAMKSGSYIINTARGPLIDQKALIENLQTGHLGGAGLDVFVNEPIPADSPLFKLRNTVLTPHIGGLTLETFREMMRQALMGIREFHNNNQ